MNFAKNNLQHLEMQQAYSIKASLNSATMRFKLVVVVRIFPLFYAQISYEICFIFKIQIVTITK